MKGLLASCNQGNWDCLRMRVYCVSLCGAYATCHGLSRFGVGVLGGGGMLGNRSWQSVSAAERRSPNSFLLL